MKKVNFNSDNPPHEADSTNGANIVIRDKQSEINNKIDSQRKDSLYYNGRYYTNRFVYLSTIV